MARKTTTELRDTKKTEDTSGEQLDLIDVTPENLKAIKPVAKKYKAAVERRVTALEEEKGLKVQILSMVKEAKLKRLADGTIRFHCDGMMITVTPRDELVKVKEDDE